MVDPTQQRGDTGRPFGPEPDKDKITDPEEFKKILKVETADEAEKREKRKLKKSQEAEEEEIVEEKKPPPPNNAFAEFMEDKNTLDDLFESESSTVHKQTTSQNLKRSPKPGEISTEGVEGEEEPSEHSPLPQNSPYHPQPPFTKQPDQSQPPPIKQPEKPESEIQDPFYVDTTAESVTHPLDEDQVPYTESLPPPDKQKETDTSLLVSQPAKDALKSKKKTPSKAKGKKSERSSQEDPAHPSKKMKKEAEEPLKEPFTDKAMPSSRKQPTSLLGKEKEKFDKVPPLSNQKKRSLQEEGEKQSEEVPPLSKQKTTSLQEEGEKQSEEVSPLSNQKNTSLPIERKEKSEEPISLGEEKTAPLSKKTTKATAPKMPIGVTFKRLTPDEVKQKKTPSEATTADNEMRTFSQEDQGMLGEGKKDEKENFPFINSDQIISTLPTSDQLLPSVTPSADTPTYSKLSSEIYELFEKMVGTVLIQNHSGITSTTITLNMPNSIFNGAQVIFDHYATAPNSYNLQLIGTPEAIKVFNENMTDLVAAFKQSQHAFEVNILNPVLKGKAPLIRRKGAAGNGSGKDKNKQ